jgi:hypothetical protein
MTFPYLWIEKIMSSLQPASEQLFITHPSHFDLSI